MKAEGIIVAGGSGTRMKSDMPKQYLTVGDSPILTHTLRRFESAAVIGSVILVVPGGDIDHVRENIVEKYGINKVRRIIAGGRQRQDSVCRGLGVLRDDTEIVVIHDGVRPFVTAECIEKTVTEAEKWGAVVTGIRLTDTLKRVSEDGAVDGTLDRSDLWCAQTPQVFRKEIILRAYDRAGEEGFYGTDDAVLVERIGVKVVMLNGSRENIKITEDEDLPFAEFMVTRNGDRKEVLP